MPHGSGFTAPGYLPPTSQSVQASYPPTFAASGMPPHPPPAVPGGAQPQAFGAAGMPPPIAGFAGMSLNAVSLASHSSEPAFLPSFIFLVRVVSVRAVCADKLHVLQGTS